MANEYLILVTGPKDNLGFDFLRNVTALANKGAVLKEDKAPTLRFPHSCWMTLETEELLEDTPGYKVQVVSEKLTREQLDDLEWNDFKRLLKRQFNIGGKNREQMTRQYLKAAFGGDDVEIEEGKE